MLDQSPLLSIKLFWYLQLTWQAFTFSFYNQEYLTVIISLFLLTSATIIQENLQQ